VPGLKNFVKSASLLASGANLKTARMPEGWVITVPAVVPDKISTTVVLNIEGLPDIVTNR